MANVRVEMSPAGVAVDIVADSAQVVAIILPGLSLTGPTHLLPRERRERRTNAACPILRNPRIARALPGPSPVHFEESISMKLFVVPVVATLFAVSAASALA